MPNGLHRVVLSFEESVLWTHVNDYELLSEKLRGYRFLQIFTDALDYGDNNKIPRCIFEPKLSVPTLFIHSNPEAQRASKYPDNSESDIHNRKLQPAYASPTLCFASTLELYSPENTLSLRSSRILGLPNSTTFPESITSTLS